MAELNLEKSIIGSMINDQACRVLALQKISKKEVFQHTITSKVFESIQMMFVSNTEIDAFSVKEYIKKNKLTSLISDEEYKSLLSYKLNIPNLEQRIKKTKDDFLYRVQIETAKSILDKANDGLIPPDELILEAIKRLEESLKFDNNDTSKSFGSVLQNLQKEMENPTKKKQGLSTGYPELDKFFKLTDGDLIVVGARPSMGKCLGKGTKVLMYDGSIKNVEDVKVGDVLMGDDSTPRNVLSLGSGREMMYKIVQKKGITYRVNENHILSLVKSRNSYNGDDYVNISVKDYISKSGKFKSSYKGYKRAIDFKQKEVPLDPYFLGIWLGDGNSRDSRITNPDNEVFEFCEKYAKSLGGIVSVSKNKTKCLQYGITGIGIKKSIKHKLRLLGLLQNKHIPDIYLKNSKDVRLNILAGLIDSDGFVNKNFGDTIEITSKYKELANGIKFLCDTLGYRTSIKQKTGKIKSTGFVGTYWKITFNGNVNEIPNLIPRKKPKEWTDFKDWRNSGIEVVKDKIDNYYGFELDGNHLFCLEDCTITHNTAFLLELLRRLSLDQNSPTAVFSLEMNAEKYVKRIASRHLRINSYAFDTSGMGMNADEKNKFNNFVANFSTSPLIIEDNANIDANTLIAKIIVLAMTKGVKTFAIDHLGLVDIPFISKSDNVTNALTRFTRTLKRTAMSLGIRIIALSQLGREVERRDPPRPIMSDLRDSGSLEADSDIVILLYRADYYETNLFEATTKTEKEYLTDYNGKYIAIHWEGKKPTALEIAGKCEVIIAKNRDGKTGKLYFDFIKKYGAFDYDDHLSSIINKNH